MKKLFLLVAMMAFGCMVMASFVPRQDARQLAITFYTQHHPGFTGTLNVGDGYNYVYQGTPTIYTFNYSTGGFILVAADDASIPILGYSFENEMPGDISTPSVKAWLEGYSREIYQIISHRLSNSETRKAWDLAGEGKEERSVTDVNPLLTTTWDQGCNYNAQCPADASAMFSCGHVYTGCVATAMTQIMKYHNSPAQGVGSHSYTHPVYGVQTANFGATTYNWASMPNNVTSSNPAVASIMYHAGVSVNMQYDPSGSGAYSEDVPDALMDYFNYLPGVEIRYKSYYPNVEDFKTLLRSNLDQSLPIYYSGSGSGGHAWVCDGYHLADGKFHFNWGWSGSSNGWYAIGALNPGGSSFNDNNSVVLNIRPGNPNLIVRIAHPVNNAVIGVGYPAEIEAVTLRGIPLVMKLFIDDVEKFSVTNDTLAFTWNTTASDLGSHKVRVYSCNATDTVYYETNLNVAEWISQASGFATPSRGINYMSAADSNVVWATAFDEGNPTAACSDFTRTINGGTTWTPGVITNTTGLAQAMIFAMDGNTAYVAMYKVSGSKPMGIYATTDGGTTWTRQATAAFSNANSFPNCIHFFNANDGWCMGDPINNDFEMYTTTNGGTTWTQVPGANIPNPVSGEFGVVGYYSAVHDTIWFGTNLGRVYRSTDKGLTYNVSTVTPFNGKYVEPSFRSGLHGLVQDKGAGSIGEMCETIDGGLTWTAVTTTGPVYATDLVYIPGTENTWVSSGSSINIGSSYSFDGGHTWTDFMGTQGAMYMQMAWVNNHCGWAGGVNASATENGAYKFIGRLRPPLPAPTNLQAIVNSHNVDLTWNAPAANPAGYNIYRNGLKLNASPVAGLAYTDMNVVSGHYTYCVKALYLDGESDGDCAEVDVAVAVGEHGLKAFTVYPNPASDLLMVQSADNGAYQIMDYSGMMIKTGRLEGAPAMIDIHALPAGIYFLRVTLSGLSVKFIKIDSPR
ncbi:MAG: C10 family peptidase [Bacteroidetes bacterium]|nr:C10 family peptidase [Bacteroidota bacterium]